MAKRTPLGTSGSFTVNPFNPSETEFQAYWGVYQWDASDPPNLITGRSGSAGSLQLPNEQNNPLSLQEFDKLRVGDIAGTAEDAPVAGGGIPAAPTDNGLFVCIYPGTAGNGDAVWVRLDDASVPVVQVVRDAHVIVVAQEGRLTTLGGSASPPLAPNLLNLLAPGDVVNITCDYLDTGNGAQLEQALLAAAAAGGIGIDVRLRSCNITLTGLVGTFLIVPQGCRLIGAGRTASFLRSKTVDDQRMIRLGTFAELIDIGIVSAAPTGALTGPATGALIFTSGTVARVKNCTITMLGDQQTARQIAWAFWDESATAQVLDTDFFGQNQADSDIKTNPVTAILMGDPTGATFTTPAFSYEISRCNFYGSDEGPTGFQRLLLAVNIVGTNTGSMADCHGFVTRPALSFGGAIGCGFTGVTAGFALLPRLDNIRVVVGSGEDGTDGQYAGVAIVNSAPGLEVTAPSIRGVQIGWKNSNPQAVVPRISFLILCAGAANEAAASVSNGVVEGCQSINASTGILITVGKNGTCSVERIRITGCSLPKPLNIGAGGAGVRLITSGAGATIDAIGIVNCGCTDADAGSFGIDVATAAVSNTIIVANNLTPNGGTAYQDNGTGTELGHNIL